MEQITFAVVGELKTDASYEAMGAEMAKRGYAGTYLQKGSEQPG